MIYFWDNSDVALTIYSLSFLIILYLFHKHIKQIFPSLLLSLLCISVYKESYELGWWIYLGRIDELLFSEGNVLFVDSSFIAFIVLTYLLYNMKWKLNKIFYLSFFIYASFTALWSYFGFYWGSVLYLNYRGIVPRLIGIFPFLSLAYGGSQK